MTGHQDVWRTEPDGVLVAELDTYRLLVQAPERIGGSFRFLVLRRDGDERALALIGSGNEADLRTAMKAAGRMANRFAMQSSIHHAIRQHIGADAGISAG